MAEQIKVNPIYDNKNVHFNGKSVTSVAIDLNADVTGKFGPLSAFQAVLRTVSQLATPIMIGEVTLGAGTGVFTVFFEGDFTQADDFGAAKNQSFEAFLQAQIRALGTVDSVDLSGAEVAAPSLYTLVS